MRRAALVLVGAIAVLASGCSSDGGFDGGTATTTTDAAARSTTTAPKPLEDQSPPGSINGITVQGDTLWVASIKGDEILQVDRETGKILQRFDTDGAGPDDVAVAPDGSVWSTGFVNGDVGRIDDGRYEVVTTIEAGINPIEFTPDGTLYVGTLGPDGTLYEVPTDGSKAKEVLTGLPDINAFGALDDGTLLAPAGGLGGPGSAVQIDPQSGKITTVVGDLQPVAAAATDADGQPFLLANISGDVLQIDRKAKTATVVRAAVMGAPFDNLAFAEDGTLYLSSFVAPAITEVTPDGSQRVISIGG